MHRVNIGIIATLGIIAIELKTTVLCLFVVVCCCFRCSGRSEADPKIGHHTTKEEPQYHRKAVRYGTIILRTVGKKKGGASKKD